GGRTETALVKELQWEVLGQGLLHIEFRRVVRGQETEAEVELEFAGVPKGGVLQHLITHVTVKAEPQNLPDSIPVKVDHLEPGKPALRRRSGMAAGGQAGAPARASGGRGGDPQGRGSGPAGGGGRRGGDRRGGRCARGCWSCSGCRGGSGRRWRGRSCQGWQ